MRKTALLTILLLVVAAWATAQQPTSPAASTAPGQEKTEPRPSADTTTIEGCLGGSSGNYTVTDKSGTSYKLLLPDDSKNAVLDKHVGQDVRVNGTLAKADSTTAPGAGESKEAAEASKGQASIKATSLEKIADTCSSATQSPSKK